MENAVHARLASSSDISNAPVVVFHESLRIVDEQFLQFAPLHFRRLQINNPLHTTNHQLDQIEKRKDNSDDDQYERQRLRCIARIVKRFPPFVEAKHFATVGGREMCMCMARSVVEGGRGGCMEQRKVSGQQYCRGESRCVLSRTAAGGARVAVSGARRIAP